MGTRRFGDRRFSDKRFGDRRFGDRRFGDRHFGDRGFGDRRFGDRRFGDRRFGDRRFGDRLVIGRFGDKVSPKRLLTGWEENCRRNVSSKNVWKHIYEDYNINYQETWFCVHHIEDII